MLVSEGLPPSGKRTQRSGVGVQRQRCVDRFIRTHGESPKMAKNTHTNTMFFFITTPIVDHGTGERSGGSAHVVRYSSVTSLNICVGGELV